MPEFKKSNKNGPLPDGWEVSDTSVGPLYIKYQWARPKGESNILKAEATAAGPRKPRMPNAQPNELGGSCESLPPNAQEACRKAKGLTGGRKKHIRKKQTHKKRRGGKQTRRGGKQTRLR